MITTAQLEILKKLMENHKEDKSVKLLYNNTVVDRISLASNPDGISRNYVQFVSADGRVYFIADKYIDPNLFILAKISEEKIHI